ncbi:hypothetical protein A6V39_03445 [Candidatus Mycoplasma haematobovis]|uniref:Uncharacterized protein n=1 Tax=Candidatus Mycoplasma haematobovis TaxID=432608 RepID=A0A1A9QE31_9MOLU|nr:hypothetical protein [Candidatus Mycoplasma haematobovis]OAL09940.1 hypothetical protein A6V39_03445 [Candidatus Mycoplasma haematobovis]
MELNIERKKQIAIKLAAKRNNALVYDLEIFKDKLKNIEKWCQNNYRTHYDDDNDLRFRNVQIYCIYNNRDKLQEGLLAKVMRVEKQQILL